MFRFEENIIRIICTSNGLIVISILETKKENGFKKKTVYIRLSLKKKILSTQFSLKKRTNTNPSEWWLINNCTDRTASHGNKAQDKRSRKHIVAFEGKLQKF